MATLSCQKQSEEDYHSQNINQKLKILTGALLVCESFPLFFNNNEKQIQFTIKKNIYCGWI